MPGRGKESAKTLRWEPAQGFNVPQGKYVSEYACLIGPCPAMESPAGDSLQSYVKTTSFQVRFCFLESWEVAETQTEMSWREAGSLPDSKNLVRGHTHAHTNLTESWRYCPVTGFKPAEPPQHLNHTKAPTLYFQGSHSPYTVNFHELSDLYSGKKLKANKTKNTTNKSS